jgi:hypothetical protein
LGQGGFGLDHGVGHFVEMAAQHMDDALQIRVAAGELPPHP